jgi:hypothetical protein
MERLPVWVSVTKQGNCKTEASFAPRAGVTLEHVPLQQPHENLRDVCHSLTSVLADIRAVGTFRLQEATIHVETASGGKVNLTGTGARRGQGAITLKSAE